jgi:spermidine synthase
MATDPVQSSPPAAEPRPRLDLTIVLFALPIFLGAFLLFQVQPIIARCILPWFGGTPAVWTTCMLFFQMLLLAGYGYAHWLVMRQRPRAQALIHGSLMALSVALMALLMSRWGVAIIPDASWKPQTPDWPIPRILALLTVAVGLPYLVLSTTSPLLQAWFSRAHPTASPYRLYTLSNAGSLLALLSYPVLIEPSLAMRAQGTLWSALYGVFIVGYAVCAVKAARAPELSPTTQAAEDRSAPPTARDKLLWVALAALASTMLLAVTNQVCQEIAVIPFLWVLPLSLYLLTFIICFDNPRWYWREVYLTLMMIGVAALTVVLMKQDALDLKVQIPTYAAALFVCCMFCHGEVVARRPAPRYLTGFYLAMSIGGALGGLFVALVAPLIFKRFYELYVALGLCWALGLVTLWRWEALEPMLRKPLVCVLIAATALAGVWLATRPDDTESFKLLSHRSFYGAFYVSEEHPDKRLWRRHKLVHGGTVHGVQYLDPRYRHAPLSYYANTSGIGLALLKHPRRLALRDNSLRIGVVGLGTGTIAAYGRTGDTIRFYEINPGIVKMAQNPKYFSYLSDTPAKVEIALGDARLSLERELRETGPQRFDILALDAFSSDAIPAHLLTREAVSLYLQHLNPDGILAIHTSNRALDLKPITFGLADSYGLQSALISDSSNNRPGVYRSDWILCTRSKTALQVKAIRERAQPREETKRLRLWTDDYYNLFQILK